jgi:hypothetical protein
MASQDRIKQLLGTGLSAEVVASTIGVHPSYISQLMSEETFYNEVIELRTKTLAAASVRDRGIDEIESMLIEKLHEQVSTNAIYKPRDLLHAFALVNRATRRGVSAQQGTVINNQVINLTLKKKVVNNFKTNDLGEVVEVEGQTLVTMPASTLLKTLISEAVETDPKNAERFKQVERYLPQGLTVSSEGLEKLNEIPQERRGPDLSRINKTVHGQRGHESTAIKRKS